MEVVDSCIFVVLAVSVYSWKFVGGRQYCCLLLYCAVAVSFAMSCFGYPCLSSLCLNLCRVVL